MAIYTFPVVYVTYGHVEVEADSPEEAKAKAEELNKSGVNPLDIRDADHSSEVFVNGLEE